MQLATLLIGLISATALWSGVQALNQQARTSYDRAAATFGGTRTAMLAARNGTSFSQKLFVDLRRAGWPVSPVLEGRIQIDGRSFRLLGIEPVTLPVEVGNAPAVGRDDFRAFMTPPGTMLVAPETLSDLNLAEGARAQANGGALLPPLRVQPNLVPGVLVVDIGIAQDLLKMPDQISRLLIGKAAGKRAPLESISRRPASPDRTRCRDRPRTPHRQFSSEPDRVRAAVVLRRTVHRQFGDRARVRTAAAGAAHLARLRRLGADAQRRAGVRTGVAGIFRGTDRAGVRLLHRRRTAARCRSLPARALWRADSWATDAQAAMVVRRDRHQHSGRARGRRRQPDQSATDAAARHRAAFRLAAGAAALADLPERAGARGVRHRRRTALVRRFPDCGFCRARGADARRGADPADVSGVDAVARAAFCAGAGQRLVLGRQPPAIVRAVARADGAAAGAGRQCRRLHHGREL